MPGTDGQPHWLTDEEQQAWRATVQLSQLLLRQLGVAGSQLALRDTDVPGQA